MLTTQEVIYRAATLAQANLLKNVLAEQGIEAHVTNTMLQQAAGDLPFGGPIEPRVVVDAADAAEARRIAVDFDQVVAPKTRMAVIRRGGLGIKLVKLFILANVWFVAYSFAAVLTAGMALDVVVKFVAAAGFGAMTLYVLWPRSNGLGVENAREGEDLEGDEPSRAPEAPWPTCPECSRQRITSCPVCETSGTDFPRAFTPAAEGEAIDGTAPAADKLVVLCTICDEPFAPQFPSRCEWCGHQFADGHELVPKAHASELEMDPRAWIVIVGLIAVLAGLMLSFLYIARG